MVNTYVSLGNGSAKGGRRRGTSIFSLLQSSSEGRSRAELEGSSSLSTLWMHEGFARRMGTPVVGLKSGMGGFAVSHSFLDALYSVLCISIFFAQI